MMLDGLVPKGLRFLGRQFPCSIRRSGATLNKRSEMVPHLV